MQYAASLPEQQVPHSVSSAEMLKALVWRKMMSGFVGCTGCTVTVLKHSDDINA